LRSARSLFTTSNRYKLNYPRHFHATPKAFAAKEMTVRDAINQALDEEMARDERVFLIGEEVGTYQGAYKVTKGLIQKYGPERVVDSPITEAGFCGLGIGAAMIGARPVVEFMTWNFGLQGIDNIVQTAAKSRYMSGGAIECPIVFRGPNGPPTAVGAQHSQDFAAWYGSIPGLKVVAIWDCEDAKGLTKAAIRDPNPVIVLESELGYNYTFSLSEEAQHPDFLIPIGKAKVEKEGKDVTIIGYGRFISEIIKASTQLQKEGINAEIINLRSIRPLDVQTIVNSIMKTNRVVTCEEGFPQSGVGAELIALINEYAFDYLDAPPERITLADVPMPYAKSIEDLAIPAAHNVVSAVKRVCYRKK